MRLWLKDSERRPDPAPVETDDRKAMLIGLGAWATGTVVLLVGGPLIDGWNPQWLITCAVGLLLGILGLIYTIRRRRL